MNQLDVFFLALIMILKSSYIIHGSVVNPANYMHKFLFQPFGATCGVYPILSWKESLMKQG